MRRERDRAFQVAGAFIRVGRRAGSHFSHFLAWNALASPNCGIVFLA
jgi:hypothetical protein